MRLIKSFTVVGRSDEIHRGCETDGDRVGIAKQETPVMIFPRMETKETQQSLVTQGQIQYFGPHSGLDQISHHCGPPKTFSLTVQPPSHFPLLLATSTDGDYLSPYQCLLREQIELFGTNADHLTIKAQGRNTPIQVGQIGIRCRHCVPLTRTDQLEASAIQFSRSVNGIYQVALKMGRLHIHGCRMVPENLKKRLLELKDQPRRRTAGRQYWKETLETQGLVEDGKRIRFNKPNSAEQGLVLNKAFGYSPILLGSAIN